MDTSKHIKGGEGEDSGMRQPVGGNQKRNKKRQSQNDHQDGGNSHKIGGEGDVPKVGGDKYMSGGKCVKTDGTIVEKVPKIDPNTKTKMLDADRNPIMQCPADSIDDGTNGGGRRRRRKSRKARKSRKSRKGRKSRKH
jgi:hypothetical protein